MNYSEFSFWFILIAFAVPYFGVRAIAKSLNLWRDSFDAIGLMVWSLMLFLNTDRTSFAVFAFDVVFNYLMVAWILRLQGSQARLVAAIVIIFDIAILAYFKYLVFFVEGVVGLLINIPDNWRSLSPIPIRDRIPPGVSFYTFQMIGFVVDSLTARKKSRLVLSITLTSFLSFRKSSPALSNAASTFCRKWKSSGLNFRLKTLKKAANGYRLDYL